MSRLATHTILILVVTGYSVVPIYSVRLLYTGVICFWRPYSPRPDQARLYEYLVPPPHPPDCGSVLSGLWYSAWTHWFNYLWFKCTHTDTYSLGLVIPVHCMCLLLLYVLHPNVWPPWGNLNTNGFSPRHMHNISVVCSKRTTDTYIVCDVRSTMYHETLLGSILFIHWTRW